MEKSALHRLSLSGEGNGARGVMVCLPQSYFNVGWERKAHQAHPACAKADAESLGGTQGLRLVGSVQEQAAGCQQGMLSAVLGAGCWSSSMGALGLVWLTPSRSSSRGTGARGFGEG